MTNGFATSAARINRHNESTALSCCETFKAIAKLHKLRTSRGTGLLLTLRRRRFCFAILVASQLAMASACATPSAKPAIVVLDFELNDLTYTPAIAEEQERTASIGPLLRQTLETQHDFELVNIDSDTQLVADKSFGYLFDHHDIAAQLGLDAGSDWIVVGRVHKASYLFVYFKALLINTKSQRLIADLTVEVKGPQTRLTVKGVETLGEQIAAAIDAQDL